MKNKEIIRDNPPWADGAIHTVCTCHICGETYLPRYLHICETFNSFPTDGTKTVAPKDRAINRSYIIKAVEACCESDGIIHFDQFYKLAMAMPCYKSPKKDTKDA